MSMAVIIVAAGSGSRIGSDVPKAYLPLAGVPLLLHTLQALRALRAERTLCVIAPEHLTHYLALNTPVPYVFGGADRSASVRAGLAALQSDPPTYVAVHDAARPFVSPDLLQRLRAAVSKQCGAVPVLPVYDTLRRDGVTLPREGLVTVQTPQVFPYAALCAAYAAHPDPAGDEGAVFLHAGGRVHSIPGDPDNFKITDAADLRRAAARLMIRTSAPTGETRVGHGIDIHPFDPDKTSLTLGGIIIPHTGLRGHSDADALLHALTDAVLGVAGADDIGTHFPPEDPQWAGAASDRFLTHALSVLYAAGGRLTGVDMNVLCERPKIAPVRAAIRERIAQLCGLDPRRVNLKAGTTERMGFLGRGEGLMCTATVTAVFA